MSHAILLAGGKGSRLRPYTDETPKALVRIGDYTILEIILRQLRVAGFTRVTLCVSHLAGMVADAIRDGSGLGIAVDYCHDVVPLGTAAPLGLVQDWTSPALVMNGDILTAMDFADVMASHRRSGAMLTVAARQHPLAVPFGVIDTDGEQILSITEKPSVHVDVSVGIQIVDPGVRTYITEGAPMDMPDLVTALIKDGRTVRAHRFSEPWFDIGTVPNLRAATKAFDADRGRFLAESELSDVAASS